MPFCVPNSFALTSIASLPHQVSPAPSVMARFEGVPCSASHCGHLAHSHGLPLLFHSHAATRLQTRGKGAPTTVGRSLPRAGQRVCPSESRCATLSASSRFHLWAYCTLSARGWLYRPSAFPYPCPSPRPSPCQYFCHHPGWTRSRLEHRRPS